MTGAQAGTLAFLVGGTPEGFQLSEPILAYMGKRIIHCGPSGAGLGAKICNNLILGVQQIVVAEGMLLGQKLGLDPAVLAGVINSSTGGCWASSVNNPVPSSLPEKSPPCEREYEGGFATALMLKVRFPILSPSQDMFCLISVGGAGHGSRDGHRERHQHAVAIGTSGGNHLRGNAETTTGACSQRLFFRVSVPG